MKYDQLTEYNMIKMFFENSYTTCSGDTVHRPFSKTPN